ncbi:MAG: class I SAM-dependent methyltransferase, partial [Chloroflexi bacterium]|nr:class I SAM-dependent methyltransferase [Chloroflexota bacterium]
YDSLFLDGESLEENQAVIDMLGDLQDKSVLDVGCGTGLLLDYALPQRYTGIDPSHAMLERLLQKHPKQRGTVLCTPLRSFVGGRYDVIIALFGAASYLTYEELQRIPDLLVPGGRYFLMFYKEGYVPITHIKAGIHPATKTFDGSLPGAVQEYHNFVIVEGGV